MRCSVDIKSENMATKKITLAFITVIAACMFQACNGSHDKTGTDTQGGEPSATNNAGGSDTSHTTDQTRETVEGVKPKTGTAAGAGSATGPTTAQGQTGADSTYQKATQKSMK